MDTQKRVLDQEKRLLDKYIKAVYVYWSALLTVNGLLLTFFSLDAISNTGEGVLLHYLLIGSCTMSLWLVLWNFKMIKAAYFKIGTTTVDDMPDVPEEIRKTAQSEDHMRRLIDEYTSDWRQEQKEKAVRKQKWMMRREKAVEALLVLETLLIGLILITSA